MPEGSRISDRAMNFAKKLVKPPEPQPTDLEKDVQFAKDWMTDSGVREARKRVKEMRSARK